MLYIYDTRHFPGGATLAIETLNKPRNNDMQLLQSKTSSSLKGFSSYSILIGLVLRNISLEDQLLVHYVNNIETNGWGRL